MYIYIWYHTILIIFIKENIHLRRFSVSNGHMIKGDVLKIGRNTRGFTLVGKWRNSPEWYICNICHPRDNLFIAFLHVSDHFERFCKKKMKRKKKTYHGSLTRYVKLWVAHAPGMSGTFSPPLRVSDPDMHHGTCVTHVPWCMSGSLTNGFLWKSVAGKTFPAFPAHAQPSILRIW